MFSEGSGSSLHSHCISSVCLTLQECGASLNLQAHLPGRVVTLQEAASLGAQHTVCVNNLAVVITFRVCSLSSNCTTLLCHVPISCLIVNVK